MAQGREFLMQLASQHAQRAGLPAPLFHNLVNQESRWNVDAVSPVGARGLTQIMPATGKSPGFGVAPISDPSDPAENLRFGADYAGAMYRRYDQDPVRMAIAYNAGPGVADKWNGNMASLPQETQGYVKNVALPFLQQQGGNGGNGGQVAANYGAGQDIAAPPLPPSLLDMPASSNSPVTTIADIDIAQGGNKFHPGLGLQSIGAAIAAGSQGVSAADALGQIRESYFAEQDAAYQKKREEMARQAAVEILGGPDSALGQAVLQGMPLEEAMQVYAQERGFQQQTAMAERGFYHDRSMQEDQQVFGAGQQQAGFQHDQYMQADDQGYRSSEAQAERDWRTGERMADQGFTSSQNEADRQIERDRLRASVEESKRNFNTEVTREVNKGTAGREAIARMHESLGDAEGAAKVRQTSPTAYSDPAMVNAVLDSMTTTAGAASPDAALEKLREFQVLSSALDYAKQTGDTTLAMALENDLMRRTTTVTQESPNIIPKPGTLEANTVAVPDPNHPSGFRAVPIGGSPEERELAAEEAAKAAGISSDLYKSSNVLGAIDTAMGQTSGASAGFFGQLTRGVGGTPAKNLEATLATVGSNIGFDRLTQMRKESPTGGALGSITEGELKLLQSTIASIDPDQSPDQLRANLATIRDQYLSMVKRVQTSNASDAEKRAALLALGMKPEDVQPGTSGVTSSGVKYRVKQ